MDTPEADNITLTSFFAHHIRANDAKPNTVLAPDEEAYLNALVAGIRAGQPAIIAVNQNGETKYMYANMGRVDAIETMAKMTESTVQKLRE